MVVAGTKWSAALSAGVMVGAEGAVLSSCDSAITTCPVRFGAGARVHDIVVEPTAATAFVLMPVEFEPVESWTRRDVWPAEGAIPADRSPAPIASTTHEFGQSVVMLVEVRPADWLEATPSGAFCETL